MHTLNDLIQLQNVSNESVKVDPFEFYLQYFVAPAPGKSPNILLKSPLHFLSLEIHFPRQEDKISEDQIGGYRPDPSTIGRWETPNAIQNPVGTCPVSSFFPSSRKLAVK